jgi:hypothetical protein
LPDGRSIYARAGAIVGRLAGADVRIDDPRVSEAHALVSLRGRDLKLLALGGAIEVDGRRAPRAVLKARQSIRLAVGLELKVLDVVLPTSLIALEVGDAPAMELAFPTASLIHDGSLRLVRGFVLEARAHVWAEADRWRIRLGDSAPEELSEGGVWTIAGVELRAVRIPIEQIGAPSTIDRGRLHVPLRLHKTTDNMRIFEGEQEKVLLSGQMARILGAITDEPVPWHEPAGEVWPAERDPLVLRQNWDAALYRLRKRLRVAGLRDLVRTDGTGNVALALLPGDRVEG